MSVFADRAESIEFVVEALADHAALAQRRRRFVADRAAKKLGQVGQPGEVVTRLGDEGDPVLIERRDDGRQGVERVAQRGQVARAGAAEHDAARDPLDVGHLFELTADALAGEIVGDEVRDRILAGDDSRRVGQGHAKPVAELARADRVVGAVYGLVERAILRVAAHRPLDLERAPTVVVDLDIAGGAAPTDRGNMREAGLLRFDEVLHDAAGRTQRRRHSLESKPRERRHAEMIEQRFLRLIRRELVLRASGDGGVADLSELLGDRIRFAAAFVVDKQLGGSDADEFVEQVGRLDVHRVKPAAREFDDCQPDRLLTDAHGDEGVVVGFVEERVLGERAGRHDADDLALDDALGLLGILDLLADGDLVSGDDELSEIVLERVVGDSGERDRVAAFAARGQGDAQHLRAKYRVVVERFVEVAHAKEQDRVADLLFLIDVLAHRGGEVLQCGGQGRRLSGRRRGGGRRGGDGRRRAGGRRGAGLACRRVLDGQRYVLFPRYCESRVRRPRGRPRNRSHHTRAAGFSPRDLADVHCIPFLLTLPLKNSQRRYSLTGCSRFDRRVGERTAMSRQTRTPDRLR